MTTAHGLATAEWVVCASAARWVWSGVAECPRNGPTGLATCIDCRFLETLEGERDLSCSAEIIDPGPSIGWEA